MAITEKTLIPIGVAVVVIGGGSMWLTSLYAKVNELEEQVSAKAHAIERIQDDVYQIKLDVREIKTLMGGRK